jgi:hypothetical protein
MTSLFEEFYKIQTEMEKLQPYINDDILIMQKYNKLREQRDNIKDKLSEKDPEHDSLKLMLQRYKKIVSKNKKKNKIKNSSRKGKKSSNENQRNKLSKLIDVLQL